MWKDSFIFGGFNLRNTSLLRRRLNYRIVPARAIFSERGEGISGMGMFRECSDVSETPVKCRGLRAMSSTCRLWFGRPTPKHFPLLWKAPRQGLGSHCFYIGGACNIKWPELTSQIAFHVSGLSPDNPMSPSDHPFFWIIPMLIGTFEIFSTG